MAVTKFVRAQDILKEKGFKAPPFDTAGFQNAVVEFFQKNDVSANLPVIPIRFVKLPDPPECGFSKPERVMLHALNSYSYCGYYPPDVKVIESDRMAERLEEIGGFVESEDGQFLFFEYRNAGMQQIDKGGHTDANGNTYARYPVVFVDEPYAANAVALLKMAGFIVSRKHKWRENKYLSCYDVTLV